MMRILSFIVIFLLHLSTAFATNPVIVVLGDSISAAYGLDIENGWVNLLQTKLTHENYNYQVINASSSGDTSAGGLSRLPALLQQHQPAIVIVELGGNDGLRGLPLKQMHANLANIIQLCQAASSQVLLAGMQIPPNYGKYYTERFYRIYTELAEHYQTGLVPFLLQAIADNPNLLQEDGIHPTAAAQTLLLQTIWPHLQPMLLTAAQNHANQKPGTEAYPAFIRPQVYGFSSSKL